MTIPTLMAKYYEHKTVTTLKETFSILTQSAKLLDEMDEGKPEEWGITGSDEQSAEIIGNKFKKVLKVAVDCGISNEKKCIAESYDYLDNRTPVDYTSSDPNYKLVLLNGGTIMFFGLPAPRIVKVLVDTNGSAPPNCWGRDLFEIDYMSDKSGFFLDGDKNAGTNSHSLCATVGWGCASYVVTYGNMDYLHK